METVARKKGMARMQNGESIEKEGARPMQFPPKSVRLL